MTAAQRPSLVDYRANGKPPKPTFSAEEMQGRQDRIRGWMAKSNVDACLFTSYHNICYLADFLYCSFGRKYGLVITQKAATTVSAAIDGGQPARRTFGNNVTYTDWSKENYFTAVQGLIKGAKVLAWSSSRVSIDFRKSLQEPFRGGICRCGRRPNENADDHPTKKDMQYHQDDLAVDAIAGRIALSIEVGVPKEVALMPTVLGAKSPGWPHANCR